MAFAAVVSFMGLGLVDPILPAIAKDLDASPSQVELLFTSYFAVTGVSMLVTSAVASRIGAKRTLLAGLALIVLFSALAGASDSIGAIVGLRAGWGLGNALFIATALSVIIGSASGGVAGAVILYEAALGLGISVGPLLGGELGAISWRGPFFGVAVLMAIGLRRDRGAARPDARAAESERTSVLDPLRALRHREVRGERADRRLLQLRLLHAARLHAVRPGPRRARARLRVLRLGPDARDLRGVRRAGDLAPDRRRPRPRRHARGFTVLLARWARCTPRRPR